METIEYRAEVYDGEDHYAGVISCDFSAVQAAASLYVRDVVHSGGLPHVEYWKCQLLTDEGEPA